MKLLLPLLLLLAPVGPAPQDAPDLPKPLKETYPPEIDEKTEAAIEKGLDYLARLQQRDGSLRSNVAVAATSLAGLAWLAHGDTSDRGRYQPNVRDAVKYILKHVRRNGYIEVSGSSAIMHGHGYAVLFLAQAYGTSSDPELRDDIRLGLTRAIRLIERSQNKFGGWNSSPNPNAQDDGSGAIAVMQIMGLRAGREVGIAVDTTCITKAKKYLKEMTNKSGWYQYNYGSRTGNRRSSALTGAGMYMLGAFDLYDDEKYAKGIANIMKGAPHLGGSASGDSGWQSWYLYTGFYSSIAIFQHGGKHWRRWWPAMRKALLSRQLGSGAWQDSYGGVYTALALLTLELPYRMLPVFQTGGKGREGN